LFVYLFLKQEMHAQELEHKAAFDKLMADNRVRPTAMLPFWNIAGFALGIVDFVVCLFFNFWVASARTDPRYR